MFYSENFSFLNFVNIFFGAVLGFFIMVCLFCSIIALILKKHNQNQQIRSISKRAYADYYLLKDSMKDKLISSIIYEIKEVAMLVYPNKKYPFYELSINDMISGLLILNKKLKRIVDHPLFKDLKNVHIATLISLEENFARPVYQFYHHKVFKGFQKTYKAIRVFLNLFNPIFYMKKIIYYSVFKSSKKDMIIIGLDFIGNSFYEIYFNEKENHSLIPLDSDS